MKEVDKMYTAWRKCIRFVWKLPPTTHCNLLSGVSGEVYLEQQLHCMFLRFFHAALHSQNQCIRTCAQLALNGSCSSICNSLNVIVHKYRLQKYELNNVDNNIEHFLIPAKTFVADSAPHTVEAIKDFITWRDDPLTDGQTRADMNDIIAYLCTS